MCERVSGASCSPRPPLRPLLAVTVHQRPHTCHNPMGRRLQPRPPLSSQAASQPVVQPRQPLCHLLLSLAFMETAVCFTSAASPAWKGPFLPRGLGEGGMCSPVLTLCAVWGQVNRLGCGVIQCQTWSWEGLVTPQDLRVWARWSAAASFAEQPGGPWLPQGPVAGAGLWPWRRLGQEPHCFKPLVPTQLPNPLSMSGCRGG